ncbi:MAG: hypothetical protein WBW58_19815, partial [Candidatus Acidiferrum sp.]
ATTGTKTRAQAEACAAKNKDATKQKRRQDAGGTTSAETRTPRVVARRGTEQGYSTSKGMPIKLENSGQSETEGDVRTGCAPGVDEFMP